MTSPTPIYTNTDYMVEHLANPAKLVNENDRVYYKKNEESNEEEKLDENVEDFFDKYKKKDKASENKDIADLLNNIKNKHSDIASERYKSQSRQKTETEDTKTYREDNEFSEEKERLEKMDMLRKLAELAEQKVKLSQDYDINSDLKTMKFEYDLHKNIRAKRNAINWMSSVYLNIVYGLEQLNDEYNPFDLRLSGWSEQINAEPANYYDVFGEIYEKYNSSGKSMAPELKLLLMMSGSAVKCHLNISSMKANTNDPNNDLDKNPEKIKELREKAMNKTKQDQEKIEEKLKKEHENAATKAKDIQMIKNKEKEMNNVKEFQNDNNDDVVKMLMNKNKYLETELYKMRDTNEKMMETLKLMELRQLEELQKKSRNSKSTGSRSTRSKVVMNDNVNDIFNKKRTKETFDTDNIEVMDTIDKTTASHRSGKSRS